MQKIQGADGMRAIACLLVLVHHLSQRMFPFANSEGWQLAQFIGMSFNVGVSVFFVLSGMLLAKPFWEAHFAGASAPRLGVYAVRRAARIVPGFYLVTVVFFLLQSVILTQPADNPDQWLRLATSLTFTTGLHWSTFFPNMLNGPLWSISLEVISYILLPFCLLPLFRLRLPRGAAFASVYCLSIFGLIFAANAAVHYFFHTPDAGKGWEFGLQGGAKYWLPNYNPIGFFAQFWLGSCTAGIITMIQSAAWRGRARQLGLFDLFAVLALVSGTGLLIWTMTQRTGEFALGWQQQPYHFPYFAGLTGLALICGAHSRWIGAALDNRLFRYIASVSFGVYLWHFGIMEVINKVWIPDYRYFGMRDGVLFWQLTGIVVAVTFAIGTASFYFLERPMMRWAKRRFESGLVESAKVGTTVNVA
ncbi:MAG: acyltransferase [Pseudomonadota bacterium]